MRAVGTKIVHHSFGKAIWVMRFHTDAALRVPVQKFWPRLAFISMMKTWFPPNSFDFMLPRPPQKYDGHVFFSQIDLCLRLQDGTSKFTPDFVVEFFFEIFYPKIIRRFTRRKVKMSKCECLDSTKIMLFHCYFNMFFGNNHLLF